MSEENKIIPEDDVWSMVEFANAMYSAKKYGVFTPDMLNSKLLGLNNNQSQPTAEDINRALADVKNTGSQLQAYTQFMSFFDSFYQKTINYLVGILSYKCYPVCLNAHAEEWQSEEYKADKKIAYSVLAGFDYEAEFRRVVEQLLVGEIAYYAYREVGDVDKDNYKSTLQMLPQRKCMLTRRWEDGVSFDFNMDYFLDATVSIDSYPPVFAKYFRNVFYKKQGKYYPNTTFKNSYGTFATWTQTSPEDGLWAFKMNMSNFNSTPYMATALKHCINNDIIYKLQRDKDMQSAYAYLVGEMRMLESKTGEAKKDPFMIHPTTLGSILGGMSTALSRNIKQIAMPLEEVEWHQFQDKNSDMYANQLKNSAVSAVSAGRIIYSNDRMSEIEHKNAVITDFAFMSKLYSQFSKFLEFQINRKTNKYKFQIEFAGSSYLFEQEHRRKGIQELLTTGYTLPPSVIGATYGFKPHHFEQLLEETKYTKVIDKLTLLPTIHTQSGNVGAPKKSDNEISENGSISRNY